MPKMKKKEEDYFDMFVTSVTYSCEAANALLSFAKGYDGCADPAAQVAHIHEIEHTADGHFHALFSTLSRAFITPIDREDILMLAQSIDCVTDAVEDVGVSFYMLNIPRLRDDVVPILELVVKSCYELKTAVDEFRTFRKSKKIFEHLLLVNNLEEEGDRFYQAAVRKLFSGESSALEVVKWREVYRKMENCLDACEDVADNIEGVILKNS